MRSYVLDANVLLGYLATRGGAEETERLFQDGEHGRSELLMSTVNWGEVYYVLRRRCDAAETRKVMSQFRLGLTLVGADEAVAERAAELKSTYKIGYADAYAAELAISNGATLVTSDSEFRKLGRSLALRLLRSGR